MSNSTYTYDTGLGCGCGCSKPTPGLGLSPIADDAAPAATETKKDLITTAKNYINEEIPFKYKAGAVAIGVGYLWLRSRRKK